MNKLMTTISRVVLTTVQGARDIGRILWPPSGTWGEIRQLWGWQWLLLFVTTPAVLAAMPYLHGLMWGRYLGNPFVLIFPYQAGEMATALLVSPLHIYPLVVSYLFVRLRRKHGLMPSGVALMVPAFWGTVYCLLLSQGFYLFQDMRFMTESGETFVWGPVVFHFVRNMLLHGIWLVVFLIVAIKNPGGGVGLIFSVFFMVHGILFAQAFIPSFGLLDLMNTFLFDLGHQGAGTSVILSSLVKSLVASGIICFFWALLEKRLKKVFLAEESLVVPPPIPPEAVQ